MMFLRKISILSLIVICVTGFTHMATMENRGENRYKSIRLTPEIYNNANSDLSDLRILDGYGEYVPFFIHNMDERDYIETTRYLMSLTDSYVRYDNFYFDYTLAEEFERDIVATSIEFTTGDSTFAKTVHVYGSHDGIHWIFVQQDQLYRVGNHSKLEIIFNLPQRFTHYRFRLNNNLERISFDTVYLTHSVATTQRQYFVETLSPGINIEENRDRNITNIYVEGIKHLRLREITIHTDSMFQRTVMVPRLGVELELYNLSFGYTSYRNTTIPLNRSISRDDIFVLNILNGDDRPINVTGVTVMYYADDLIFEGGNNENLTLSFGGGSHINAPVFDIVRYREEILRLDIDRLEISEIIFGEVVPEPEPRDFSVIFNMVIVTVSVLLGLVILVKLKKGAV